MIISSFQINNNASPIRTIPATTPATMGMMSGPLGHSREQSEGSMILQNSKGNAYPDAFKILFCTEASIMKIRDMPIPFSFQIMEVLECVLPVTFQLIFILLICV